MTLYSLYLFNRYGDNIYCRHWRRTRAPQDGEAGLIAGFVYTLQHISSQLSSSGGSGGLLAVQTPLYKLHYYETMTGYRAALLSDKEMSTSFVQSVLAELFSTTFTTTVTRNPHYTHAQGVVITGSEFDDGLDALLRSKGLL